MSSSNTYRSVARSTRNLKRRNSKLANKGIKEVKQWTYKRTGSTTRFTALYLWWCLIKTFLTIPKHVIMIALTGHE